MSGKENSGGIRFFKKMLNLKEIMWWEIGRKFSLFFFFVFVFDNKGC